MFTNFVRTLAASDTVAFACYARMVAARNGIEVSFTGGENSYTDGKKIVIGQKTVKTNDGKDNLMGLILHEAGHVRFSDFDPKREKAQTEFERSIANIVEDRFIEGEMAFTYAGGAKSIFGKLWKNIGRDTLKDMSKGMCATASGLFVNWLVSASHEASFELMTLDEHSMALVERHEKALVDRYDAKSVTALTTDVRSILTGIASARGTQDCQTIAQKIWGRFYAFLRVWNEDKPKEKPDGRFDRVSSARSQAQADFQRDKQNGLTGGFASPMGHMGVKAVKSVDYVIPGSVSTPDAQDVSPTLNLAHGTALMRSVRSVAGQLSSSIRSLLEAKADTEVAVANRGRNYFENRLYRLNQGSSRVFMKKADDYEALNTAVCVLLDTSGSMGIETMDEAVKATLALYSTITNLSQGDNVTASVIAFPGVDLQEKLSERKNPYARYVARHGERLTAHVLGRFGAVDSYGGTPIGPALTAALYDLVGRNVERRVVVVVTDGCFTNCDEEIDALKKAGVELYGLQIGDDEEDFKNLQSLIGAPNAVQVTDTRTLPRVLLELGRKAFV